MVMGLNEGILQAYMVMVKDNKYDVYVSEADQNKTIRYEVFQDLLELVKAGIPIPPKLLIQYMDIGNSEEVIKEINAEQAKQLAMAQTAAGAKK